MYKNRTFKKRDKCLYSYLVALMNKSNLLKAT